MRVLHITEAFEGGVANSVSQLARAQAADGIDVIVAHSIRPLRTPDLVTRKALLPPPIEHLELAMCTAVSPLKDFISTLRIAGLIRRVAPDVVHLHSSKAGALGRVAASLIGARNRVFYSPRGFAFLREDVHPLGRTAYLSFEWIAARLGGGLIACSPSEAVLARARLGHKRVLVVENAIDVEYLPYSRARGGRLRIVTCGRICYQKAPSRFRKLSAALAKEAVEMVWIGDGDLRRELQPENGSADIRVAGWMDRARVYEELARSDIFVLPSLWEGMPLALIEAQGVGLPAVVSDVVGNRDVVVDGVTGFLCRTDEEFAEKTKLLVANSELRSRMGAAARERVLTRFSTQRMHLETLAAYRSLGSQPRFTELPDEGEAPGAPG